MPLPASPNLAGSSTHSVNLKIINTNTLFSQVPSPNEDQANQTTDCATKCPQGSGSPADTEAFANCVQGCISKYFYNTADGTPQSGSSGSGSSASGSEGGAPATATQSGAGSSQTSGSGSASTTGGSGSSGATSSGASPSESASQTKGSEGSQTSSGSGSSPSPSGNAAASLTGASAGLFALVAAFFAL